MADLKVEEEEVFDEGKYANYGSNLNRGVMSNKEFMMTTEAIKIEDPEGEENSIENTASIYSEDSENYWDDLDQSTILEKINQEKQKF